jgi:hypothetical protein
MVLPRSLRRANTLLEVACAVVLLSTALVPGMKFMRDAVEQGRRNDTLSVLMTECVSTMEQQLCKADANWTEATDTGSFSGDGYSTFRYSATRSQQPTDGGIVNKLMAITVYAYEDANSNSAWDSGELKITLTSKVAKLGKYTTLAGS